MKTFDTRIKAKRDTTENWTRVPRFVPLEGEIIIYTDREQLDGQFVPGVKIGDGITPGIDLPFIDDKLKAQVLEHIENGDIHVTLDQKNFWDNKVNVDYNLETLIFNRQ